MSDYDVPKWFSDHPDLTDISHRDDPLQSFETGRGNPPEVDDLRIRIWVGPADSTPYRYFMEFVGDGEDRKGECRSCYDIWIVETADLNVLEKALRWAQDMLEQHGVSMCPTCKIGDLGLFPGLEIVVFDAEGNALFPQSLPPLDAAGTDSRDVSDALKTINRKRAQAGQRPLDPQRADWSDQDVLDEAARIRMKNRLKNEGSRG